MNKQTDLCFGLIIIIIYHLLSIGVTEKTVEVVSFFMNSLLFQPESFTQILCLYFTLYYVKDKALFYGCGVVFF